jgi:hypothetical protein
VSGSSISTAGGRGAIPRVQHTMVGSDASRSSSHAGVPQSATMPQLLWSDYTVRARAAARRRSGAVQVDPAWWRCYGKRDCIFPILRGPQAIGGDNDAGVGIGFNEHHTSPYGLMTPQPYGGVGQPGAGSVLYPTPRGCKGQGGRHAGGG